MSCFKELIGTATPTSATSTLISQQPSTSREDPPSAKRYWFAESTDDSYHILAKKVSYNEGIWIVFFFRPYPIAHLIDYGIYKRFLYALGNTRNLSDLLYYDICIMQWSGAEPTISLKYDCLLLSWHLCGGRKPETSYSTTYLTPYEHVYWSRKLLNVLVSNLGKNKYLYIKKTQKWVNPKSEHFQSLNLVMPRFHGCALA